MPACRICGNATGNRSHYPRERMFGWNEPFEYLECAVCGCLQIAEVPADLARYYPAERYYSYQPPKQKHPPAWLLALRRSRSRHWLGESSTIGALLASLSREDEHFGWLRRGHVALDSRILDVGCGAGKLLLKMQRDGFTRLMGADPFIAERIDYGGGLAIEKKSIDDLDGKFDFIMLHHSFEHLPDPVAAMKGLRERLATGGTLLLRVPVADCHARRKYGLDWVAWDAPRHLFLQTKQSMRTLAGKCGFRIAELTYDSGTQQFASSELYLRGIPYVEHGRYKPGNSAESFSDEQWAAFEREAAELNARQEGDTACFYLAAA